MYKKMLQIDETILQINETVGKPEDNLNKRNNAPNIGDNINNTQSSTVTFSERKNTEYYYTQEETDENSPKTKIEQIEQKV